MENILKMNESSFNYISLIVLYSDNEGILLEKGYLRVYILIQFYWTNNLLEMMFHLYLSK